MQLRREEPTALWRWAVCIRNDGFPVALERYRAYRMLPDGPGKRYGMLRIVDESCEACLYPQEFFPPIGLSASTGDGLPRFVLCVSNEGYELDLVEQNVYERVPDSSAERSGWIRIVDESGEDYLYPETMFQVVDLPPDIFDEIGVRCGRAPGSE